MAMGDPSWRRVSAAALAAATVALAGVACSDAEATIPQGWEERQAGRVSFGLPPGLEPTPPGELGESVLFEATGDESGVLVVNVYPADVAPGEAAIQAGIREGQRQAQTPGFRSRSIVEDIEVPGTASAAVLSWTQEEDGEVVAEGGDLTTVTEDGQAVVVYYVDAPGRATQQRIDQLFDSVVVAGAQ